MSSISHQNLSIFRVRKQEVDDIIKLHILKKFEHEFLQLRQLQSNLDRDIHRFEQKSYQVYNIVKIAQEELQSFGYEGNVFDSVFQKLTESLLCSTLIFQDQEIMEMEVDNLKVQIQELKDSAQDKSQLLHKQNVSKSQSSINQLDRKTNEIQKLTLELHQMKSFYEDKLKTISSVTSITPKNLTPFITPRNQIQENSDIQNLKFNLSQKSERIQKILLNTSQLIGNNVSTQTQREHQRHISVLDFENIDREKIDDLIIEFLLYCNKIAIQILEPHIRYEFIKKKKFLLRLLESKTDSSSNQQRSFQYDHSQQYSRDYSKEVNQSMLKQISDQKDQEIIELNREMQKLKKQVQSYAVQLKNQHKHFYQQSDQENLIEEISILSKSLQTAHDTNQQIWKQIHGDTSKKTRVIKQIFQAEVESTLQLFSVKMQQIEELLSHFNSKICIINIQVTKLRQNKAQYDQQSYQKNYLQQMYFKQIQFQDQSRNYQAELNKERIKVQNLEEYSLQLEMQLERNEKESLKLKQQLQEILSLKEGNQSLEQQSEQYRELLRKYKDLQVALKTKYVTKTLYKELQIELKCLQSEKEMNQYKIQEMQQIIKELKEENSQITESMIDEKYTQQLDLLIVIQSII